MVTKRPRKSNRGLTVGDCQTLTMQAATDPRCLTSVKPLTGRQKEKRGNPYECPDSSLSCCGGSSKSLVQSAHGKDSSVTLEASPKPRVPRLAPAAAGDAECSLGIATVEPKSSATNTSSGISALSTFAEKWVQQKSRSMALAQTIPPLPIPVLSTPTAEWWATHTSTKIKHRVFNGSRDEALGLARKLHEQLMCDTVKQPLLAQDSSALSSLTALVADGRASPMHRFKLTQGIAPPRQFVPRFDGTQPDYSASSNREAITWFANNPLVSTPSSTSCASTSTRSGNVKEGHRCIAGANATTLPPPSSIYCVAMCAASAPFDVRMSSNGITPPWASDVAKGLPTVHALWA